MDAAVIVIYNAELQLLFERFPQTVNSVGRGELFINVDKNGNIISILRAAITNNPNLRLTALNNKQNEFAERQLLGENSNKGDNMSKEIYNALGLY